SAPRRAGATCGTSRDPERGSGKWRGDAQWSRMASLVWRAIPHVLELTKAKASPKVIAGTRSCRLRQHPFHGARMNQTPTRWIPTLIASAVLAALTACGGDSDTPAAMATASGDTATVPW